MDYLAWTDRLAALDRERKITMDELERDLHRVANSVRYMLNALHALRTRDYSLASFTDADDARSALNLSMSFLPARTNAAAKVHDRLRELGHQREELLAMDTSNLPGPVAEEGGRSCRSLS